MNCHNIVIVSSSRADYDLLKNIIIKFQSLKQFNTNFIITGTHLKANFGNTQSYIEKKKININKKIEFKYGGQSPKLISKQISSTLKQFSDYFLKTKPDLILILGDRFEIYAVALASYINLIPIAHIHGGEITEGSLDDSFRHSISKFSSLHLVAESRFKKRLTNMGENPKSIFNVGYLTRENIVNNNFFSRSNLEKKLKFKLKKFNILVSYHPETKNINLIKKQTKILLDSIVYFSTNIDYNFLITYPGDDFNSKHIIDEYKVLSKNINNIYLRKNLGQNLYFNCLNHFNLIIGNSSSGVLDAPYFDIHILNLGERQKNRVLSNKIINLKFNKNSIIKAISKKVRIKKKIKNFSLKPKKFTSEKIIKQIKIFLKNKKIQYPFYETLK